MQPSSRTEDGVMSPKSVYVEASVCLVSFWFEDNNVIQFTMWLVWIVTQRLSLMRDDGNIPLTLPTPAVKPHLLASLSPTQFLVSTRRHKKSNYTTINPPEILLSWCKSSSKPLSIETSLWMGSWFCDKLKTELSGGFWRHVTLHDLVVS